MPVTFFHPDPAKEFEAKYPKHYSSIIEVIESIDPCDLLLFITAATFEAHRQANDWCFEAKQRV